MQDELYSKIYDIDNLYRASKKAMKGKKSSQSVACFWINEDKEIEKIHNQLKNGYYTFGYYKEFEINDKGVLRKISAAPFKDRVVHHAIMNIIEPIFEKSFIYDSYANRKGKGVSSALYRAKYYAKKYNYYLKLDIQKYFPSIDHQILKEILKKKIHCQKTFLLLENLIDSSNKQYKADFYFPDDDLFTPFERKKGLPLGNLTSQFFGNVYLNRLDHYIKEVLRVGYIRYVDDFILFFDNVSKIDSFVKNIKDYLARFRLQLHPLKIKQGKTKDGFEFLGHKVYNTHIRLTSKNINRAKSKLIKTKYLYKYQKIDLKQAKNRIFGTIGFMKIGDNFRLTNILLAQTLLQKESVEAVSSRWELEQ